MALPIALRAHVEFKPRKNSKKKLSQAQSKGRPAKRETVQSPATRWRRDVLIFDVETTTDEGQDLQIGTFRHCEWTREGRLRCVAEGLFYADDLASHDPQGFKTLEAFAQSHNADVALGESSRLVLLSREEFLKQVFWPIAYHARGLVVGFNLPFDLSRLSVSESPARNRYRGGFSFTLSETSPDATGARRENKYRPRLCIKHIDSKRSLIGFAAPQKDEGDGARGSMDREQPHGGHFLDLRTLAFALTDKSYSLKTACEAFETPDRKMDADTHGAITPEYIEYNRHDVRITGQLLEQLRAEFDRHDIALDPCKALSTASVAKAYLKAMGVQHPSKVFAHIPPTFIGYAMTSYYGGRCEARIRGMPVPVVHTDFFSMYPTVNIHMGLWEFITAAELTTADATAEVTAFLAEVSLEKCLDPALWRDLNFFALIVPDHDVLPVRAPYTSRSNDLSIGVNALQSREPLWYAGPDLVASALLTGRSPKVLQAIRLVLSGRQETLTSVQLRGAIAIDPKGHDFFKRAVEERARVRKTGTADDQSDRERLARFLKTLVNSGSYGIYAQLTRMPLPKGELHDATVFGVDAPFAARSVAPEDPGPYCFPPIAALITAGARLMLALLERMARDAGGTYAFCDTDSMAIVATEDGGLVHDGKGTDGNPIWALSWAQVDEIVSRFAALNPYDRSAVASSVLKIEDVNWVDGERTQLWCFAVSAKRYALFTREEDNGFEIRKGSQHGLGHLRNPANAEDDESADWITDIWRCILATALGEPVKEPTWLDLPAVSQLSITTQSLLAPFRKWQSEVSGRGRIRPFNFILSAHLAPFGRPLEVDPDSFHLVAPFAIGSDKLLDLPWRDVETGQRYPVTIATQLGDEVAVLKTYRLALNLHRIHPESKSATAEGDPCRRGTVGLLARREILAAGREYIGKETNRIDDVRSGIVHRRGDVLNMYRDNRHDTWVTSILPVLRSLPVTELARSAGKTERAIRNILNGVSRPRPETKQRLLLAAARFARRMLRQNIADDVTACITFATLL